MTTMTETEVGTQVFRVYIKATPEAIWEAITSPEWAVKYGYCAPVEYDPTPGRLLPRHRQRADAGDGCSETMIDGEVIEADPTRKLVQTWRPLLDPEPEGFTRVTWDIEEDDFGLTRLTVTHELEGAPKTAATVAGIGRLAEGGGGWSWILSDLKTLLESGKALR